VDRVPLCKKSIPSGRATRIKQKPLAFGRLKKPPQIVEMAANGNLIFQETNKATFVGANSNVVIDTVNASFGVGVDVNGPTSNLHVVGNAYVTSNMEVGTANLFVDTVNSRVGIGTTDPAYSFDVQTTSDASDKTMTRLYSAANATGVSSTGLILEKGAGYGGVIKGFISQGIGSGLSLHTLNGGTEAQAMTIMNSGNVGIGTSSPTDLLDVHYPNPSYGSLTGTEEGSLTVSAGAEHSNAAVYFRTPFDAAAPAKRAIFSDGGSYSGASSGGLHFCLESTNDNTTKVDLTDSKMVIKQNGDVGIGTTSPAAQLEIHGIGQTSETSFDQTGSMGGVLALRSDDGGAGSGGAVMFGSHAGFHAAIKASLEDGSSNTRGRLAFFTRSNTTDTTMSHAMTIADGGNVGIGTTNPDKAKLHVIGSKSTSLTSWYYNASGITGQVTNYSRNLSGYFGNHLACEELQVFSDRRIKTEIEDIDDGSALILFRQIQPKTYKYLDKVERGNERVYGFVAQEIKELMPEAVDVSSGKIPNIYEVANVSNSNVITFTHFNTSNLVSNSNILEVQTVHGDSQSLNIAEVVDEHVIRVDEDLSDWIGSVDESGNVASGNQLFVYGQEVNDFHHLKKSAIWTVTTAALQEVDRQQQADKARITELESQLASVLTRLDALENAS